MFKCAALHERKPIRNVGALFSTLTLIAGGGVKFRSDKQVPIGEIFELIDTMPTRIQEMQRKEGRSD